MGQNGGQGIKGRTKQEVERKFGNFEIKTLPQMHHNMGVSTVKLYVIS